MKLLITAPSPPPKRSSLWNLLILKLAKKCIHNTIYPRDWHLPLVFVFNWPLTNIQNTLSKNRYSQRSCKSNTFTPPPPIVRSLNYWHAVREQHTIYISITAMKQRGNNINMCWNHFLAQIFTNTSFYQWIHTDPKTFKKDTMQYTAKTDVKGANVIQQQILSIKVCLVYVTRFIMNFSETSRRI